MKQLIQVKKKLSVERCRVLLKENKRDYTTAEIESIRDYLYQLAQIEYDIFVHNEQNEEARIIKLNEDGNVEVSKAA